MNAYILYPSQNIEKSKPNDTVRRGTFNQSLAEQFVQWKHRRGFEYPNGFAQWLEYIKQIAHQTDQS